MADGQGSVRVCCFHSRPLLAVRQPFIDMILPVLMAGWYLLPLLLSSHSFEMLILVFASFCRFR